MNRHYWLRLGFLVSILCAVQVNYLSTMLHPRFENRGEAIAKELAVVEGESFFIGGQESYWPEFQNRVAFALVLKAVDRIGGLETREWYALLRFLAAILAFFSFWWLLWRSTMVSQRTAAGACLLLAFVMAMHFNHGWDHPSDYLDPIATVLFLWAVTTRRFAALAIITILSALNRESAVFAGLLWFCVHGTTVGFARGRWPSVRVSPRGSLEGIALMAIGYASVIGFRRLFGGDRALAQMQHTSFYYWGQMFSEAIGTLAPTSWPVLLLAIVAAPLAWVAINRRWVSAGDQGLLFGALGIFVVSAIFSLLDELRMLLPMTVVLVFVAAMTEGRRAMALARDSGMAEPVHPV